MERFGGLWRRLPFVGTALIMALSAGCGLLGSPTLPGEVTVFFGAWQVLRRSRFRRVGSAHLSALSIYCAPCGISSTPMAEEWAAVSDANAWRKARFVLFAGLFAVFGFFRAC